MRQYTVELRRKTTAEERLVVVVEAADRYQAQDEAKLVGVTSNSWKKVRQLDHDITSEVLLPK